MLVEYFFPANWDQFKQGKWLAERTMELWATGKLEWVWSTGNYAKLRFKTVLKFRLSSFSNFHDLKRQGRIRTQVIEYSHPHKSSWTHAIEFDLN